MGVNFLPLSLSLVLTAMHGHTYRHQRPKSSPDDSAAKTNSSRGKRRDMKSKNNRASSPEDFKSIRQASRYLWLFFIDYFILLHVACCPHKPMYVCIHITVWERN